MKWLVVELREPARPGTHRARYIDRSSAHPHSNNRDLQVAVKISSRRSGSTARTGKHRLVSRNRSGKQTCSDTPYLPVTHHCVFYPYSVGHCADTYKAFHRYQLSQGHCNYRGSGMTVAATWDSSSYSVVGQAPVVTPLSFDYVHFVSRHHHQVANPRRRSIQDQSMDPEFAPWATPSTGLPPFDQSADPWPTQGYDVYRDADLYSQHAAYSVIQGSTSFVLDSASITDPPPAEHYRQAIPILGAPPAFASMPPATRFLSPYPNPDPAITERVPLGGPAARVGVHPTPLPIMPGTVGPSSTPTFPTPVQLLSTIAAAGYQEEDRAIRRSPTARSTSGSVSDGESSPSMPARELKSPPRVQPRKQSALSEALGFPATEP
jgi:hypothetical protein